MQVNYTVIVQLDFVVLQCVIFVLKTAHVFYKFREFLHVRAINGLILSSSQIITATCCFA